VEVDKDGQARPGVAYGWTEGDPRDRLAKFIEGLSPEEKQGLIDAGQDVGSALMLLDAARHREFVLSLNPKPGGTNKTTVTQHLYSVGDRLPDAEVVRAADVQPGDLYWGCQERNPRKGWMLLAEPEEATQGAVPTGDGSTGDLMIGSYVGHQPDTLVLIERRAS
jgi:hypothetical protein